MSGGDEARRGADMHRNTETQGAPADVLQRLSAVIASRRGGDPDRSYVARLLSRGNDAILKKIGEEATETVMAAKDGVPERIVAETADLWFHCLVMLEFHGIGSHEVLAELARREGLSGLEEKASRNGASSEGDPK